LTKVDPRLAHPGRPRDQQVELLLDPLPGDEPVHQGLVQSAGVPIVQVLDDGGLAQPGVSDPATFAQNGWQLSLRIRTRARQVGFCESSLQGLAAPMLRFCVDKARKVRENVNNTPKLRRKKAKLGPDVRHVWHTLEID